MNVEHGEIYLYLKPYFSMVQDNLSTTMLYAKPDPKSNGFNSNLKVFRHLSRQPAYSKLIASSLTLVSPSFQAAGMIRDIKFLQVNFPYYNSSLKISFFLEVISF